MSAEKNRVCLKQKCVSVSHAEPYSLIDSEPTYNYAQCRETLEHNRGDWVCPWHGKLSEEQMRVATDEEVKEFNARMAEAHW